MTLHGIGGGGQLENLLQVYARGRLRLPLRISEASAVAWQAPQALLELPGVRLREVGLR